MTPWLEIPMILLILLGLFFMVASPLGMIRFPDFYTRMHAAGKCDSLGQALMILGFILYEGFTFDAAKLVLLIFFLYLLTPTATHAIARAAHVTGVKPWRKGEKRR
jgi:multicomponent Na+:H+ antiporter subunit G